MIGIEALYNDALIAFEKHNIRPEQEVFMDTSVPGCFGACGVGAVIHDMTGKKLYDDKDFEKLQEKYSVSDVELGYFMYGFDTDECITEDTNEVNKKAYELGEKLYQTVSKNFAEKENEGNS